MKGSVIAVIIVVLGDWLAHFLVSQKLFRLLLQFGDVFRFVLHRKSSEICAFNTNTDHLTVITHKQRVFNHAHPPFLLGVRLVRLIVGVFVVVLPIIDEAVVEVVLVFLIVFFIGEFLANALSSSCKEHTELQSALLQSSHFTVSV